MAKGVESVDLTEKGTAAAQPAPALATSTEVRHYLDSAFDRGLLDPTTYRALVHDLETWAPSRPAALAPTPPRVPVPTAPPPPVRTLPPPPRPGLPPPPIARTVPVPTTPRPVPATPRRPPPPSRPPVVTVEPAPPPPPIPITPSRLRTWWDERRAAISADLALHGLAYLGVLLMFVGVFGFVVFAFGNVAPQLRPVAEWAIPITCFGGGAFLRHRHAPFVGDALEFLGGAVLPIVVIASMTDNAALPLPPDPKGWLLVVCLVMASLAIAGAYAFVVHRRPSSTLRFLVAPLVWIAVAGAGLAFADPIPSGDHVSHPLPLQWALVTVAVTATLALVRRRPDHPLALPSELAAIPGLAVAELVTLLAAATAGWPAAPVVISGLATVVGLELLADRLGDRALASLQAAVVVVTAGALEPSAGLGWSATAAAGALVALVEWRDRRQPDRWITAGLTAAGAVAVAVSVAEPWPMVAAFAGGWIWVVARRTWPLRAGLPEAALVGAIAVLPIGVAVGLARTLPDDTTLVVLAAAVALVAGVVRLTPARLDRLWAVWLPSAAAALLVATMGNSALRPGPLAAAAGLEALAFGLAPRWPTLRVWSTASALAVAAGYGRVALDLSPATVAVILGGTGAVLVTLAAWRDRPLLGHVGLIGHLTTLAAVVVLPSTQVHVDHGAETFALGTFAFGWALTTLTQETRGSSVAALLTRAGRRLGGAMEPPGTTAALEATPSWGWLEAAAAAIPAVLATLSVPVVLPAALEASGRLSSDSAWLPVVASAVVVLGGLLIRFTPTHRRFAAVVANLGLWLIVIAAPTTGDNRAASLTATGLIIAMVVAVGPAARRSYMRWVAWLASLVATVLVGDLAGVPRASLHLLVLGWGSVVLIGALAVDDRLAGRRALGQWVRRRELRAPVVLGALAVPVGLAPTYLEAPSVYGWWSLAAAAVVLIVAVQLRTGALSIVTWGLVTVAYTALPSWKPLELPWTLLAEVIVLLVVAEATARWWPIPDDTGGLPRWTASWDGAAFVAAHAVAAGALAAALVHGWIPATWCGTGAIALAVAARRRAAPWAVAGTVLVLVGAGVAGWGPLALALAATSAGATFAATRTANRAWRTALQLTGIAAAAGAWASLCAWQHFQLDDAATATALAAGIVALAVGLGARILRLGSDWVTGWAAPPAAGLVFSAIALTDPSVDRTPTGPALAAGLTLAALAAALTAKPLDRPWLREATAVLLAAAGAALAYGLDATPTQLTVTGLAVALVTTAAALAGQQLQRATAWIRPSLLLAVTGVALADAAAPRAGHGWPTLSLTVTAVLATFAATRVGTEAGRRSLQVLGIASAAGAWASLCTWQGWPLDRIATVTALSAGALALALGLAARYLRLGAEWVTGWALLAVAGLAYAAIALGDEAQVPRSPTGPALAAGLALAALAAALTAKPLDRPWLREATAALVLAAGAALAYGLDATATQLTLAGLAVALTATVAVVAGRRSAPASPWIRPALLVAVAGIALADGAGLVAGYGWLALGLAVTSALATFAATQVRVESSRQGLQVVGVGAAAGAWASLCGWQHWHLDGSATATALAAGVLALLLALAARYLRLGIDWVSLWALLPTAGLTFGAVALTDPTTVARTPTGPALAAGLTLGALATALTARPLDRPWLREATAVLLAAAGAALAYGLDTTPAQSVALAGSVSILATVAVVALSSFERGVDWVRPALGLGTLAAGVAVWVAASQLPERPLLVAALLVAGLDTLALGVTGDRPAFLAASPVLVCLAWLTYASEALTGNAQWFTLPVGVTLLVLVGLVRWDRDRHELPRSTPPLVALEYLGMAFVVSPALVQLVAVDLTYVFVALAEGAALVAWGTLTRVRRRALFGAAGIVAAAVLVIVVPLVGLAPQIRGPWLWLTIAGIGLVTVLVAAFLEQGRGAARRAVTRLRELTADWE